MTGLGIVRRPVMIGWKCSCSAVWMSGIPSSAGSKPDLRSAPEQNAFPAPVRMTARTRVVGGGLLDAPRSSSSRARCSTAFIASGRFSVIVVTAPRRSH